ncbi:helix-turn-helix domain-containing protein [Streptomyces bobili]|uniref:helix-turn-helix domain-containing protein n=1 Tax=Streptomyces bobili TaxID=67280 RepID=UPI0037165350
MPEGRPSTQAPAAPQHHRQPAHEGAHVHHQISHNSASRPPIVVLCGSTRSWDRLAEANLYEQPVTIRLDDLDIICEVLGCEPNDLMVREPEKARAQRPASTPARAAVAGERPRRLSPRARSRRPSSERSRLSLPSLAQCVQGVPGSSWRSAEST